MAKSYQKKGYQMKKSKLDDLAVYSVAIAIWTLAFTLIVAGGIQLVFYILRVGSWTLKDIVIAYLSVYILAFASNLDVLFNDEKEDKE